ncbi:MAG: DinB family protein, partial [Acidimicrobiales bacterium]
AMTDTETLDLLHDSLLRRMRTMHSLYHQAVDTMDLSHVNHFERSGVLPIAFSLFHYTNMQDSTFMVLSGELPTWNEEWQARVQMAIDDHGKEETVQTMEDQRIGDYEAFKTYQRTVFDRTEAHIATMDPADFTRVIIAPPYPEQVASTYSARCAGPQGITVLDGFECWHYQHGLRHMGEIELARGLVGLGGMTS